MEVLTDAVGPHLPAARTPEAAALKDWAGLLMVLLNRVWAACLPCREDGWEPGMLLVDWGHASLAVLAAADHTPCRGATEGTLSALPVQLCTALVPAATVLLSRSDDRPQGPAVRGPGRWLLLDALGTRGEPEAHHQPAAMGAWNDGPGLLVLLSILPAWLQRVEQGKPPQRAAGWEARSVLRRMPSTRAQARSMPRQSHGYQIVFSDILMINLAPPSLQLRGGLGACTQKTVDAVYF